MIAQKGLWHDFGLFPRFGVEVIVTPQRAIDATTEYVDSLKNDVGPDSFARMIVSYTSTTYWEVSRHALVAGLFVGGIVGLIVGMAFMLILVRT